MLRPTTCTCARASGRRDRPRPPRRGSRDGGGAGCNQRALTIIEGNDGARRFYERLGGQVAAAPRPAVLHDEAVLYRDIAWPRIGALLNACGEVYVAMTRRTRIAIACRGAPARLPSPPAALPRCCAPACTSASR